MSPRLHLKTFFFAAAAFALAACGENANSPDGSRFILEPSLAPIPSHCSTSTLASLARSYFSNPEQQTAQGVLGDMATDCAAGDLEAAVAGGWAVLTLIETAIETGNGGDPADGAALANALMGYMCDLDGSLCTPPYALPYAPVTAAALGSQGIFAVREGGDEDRDDEDVVAHGPVPFTDFDGNPNPALWGLETSSNWATATTAPTILFYGAPTSASSIALDELSFGNLGFELNSFPDVPGFVDGQLHVGVCYSSPVTLPHEGGIESNPTLAERLQRQGTVLTAYSPAFAGCLNTQTAGLDRVFEGLLAFAGRVLLPEPLYAALVSDRMAPSSGGTPIDFSAFAPVAANTDGYLEFVTPPTDGTAGVPLETIRVQALSGEGTPMELVEIQLYVVGNQGTPAGASFCETEATEDCDDTAFTIETLDGYGTLAEFTDATLWKAGGYQVCARALDSAGATDFFFTEACSAMFHIKN
ncbi:MAG TPA: hypothetical protein VK849_04280 [Longimicrobiales bacterium]|nr:hypothetical protein [Longimicrobiales bacterium]